MLQGQSHIDEVLPSYWRVTFDNGPVNLLDPDTIEQLGALVERIGSAAASQAPDVPFLLLMTWLTAKHYAGKGVPVAAEPATLPSV